MNKFFFLFITLILGFSCTKNQRQKSLNEVTFFVEIDGDSPWPEKLKKQILNGLEELVSSKECWSIEEDKLVAIKKTTLLPCSNFEYYKSIEQLRPYRKYSDKKKFTLSYKPHSNEGKIRVKVYDWDGKQLRRVRNSGSNLYARPAQEFLVKWTLK